MKFPLKPVNAQKFAAWSFPSIKVTIYDMQELHYSHHSTRDPAVKGVKSKNTSKRSSPKANKSLSFSTAVYFFHGLAPRHFHPRPPFDFFPPPLPNRL